MPATRKQHIKSRHGCQQCKARRTKCDEVRPICTKCARKGSACSFGEDSSSLIFVEGPNSRKFLQKQAAKAGSPGRERMPGLAQGTATQSTTATHTPSASSTSTDSHEQRGKAATDAHATIQQLGWDVVGTEGLSSATVTHLEADNMRLMRHFAMYAWKACVSDPEGDTEAEMCKVFQYIIPELAYTHPFLMHCLLAMSAMHYCLAGPCEPELSTPTFVMPARPTRAAMSNLARHHQTLALPLLREAITGDIADEVRPALFAGSALVVVCSVASTLVASPDPAQGLHPDDDPIEALLQFIYLMEGISSIVRPVEQYIMATPFRSYMLPTPTSDAAAPFDPATERFLSGLRSLVDAEVAPRCHERGRDSYSASRDISVPDAYVIALAILRHTFALQRDCPGRQMNSVPFASIVPNLVVADMAARRPAALAIAAGFATSMHWLRRHIWVQGWGRCVLYAIVRSIEQSGATEARDVVQWCIDQVESGQDVDLAAPTPMPVLSGESIRETAVRIEVEARRASQPWAKMPDPNTYRKPAPEKSVDSNNPAWQQQST